MGDIGKNLGRAFLLDPTAGILSGVKDATEKSVEDVDEGHEPASPEPPSTEKAEQKERDRLRRANAAKSQTVLTSPLGVSGNENIGQKTLLGQ